MHPGIEASRGQPCSCPCLRCEPHRSPWLKCQPFPVRGIQTSEIQQKALWFKGSSQPSILANHPGWSIAKCWYPHRWDLDEPRSHDSGKGDRNHGDCKLFSYSPFWSDSQLVSTLGRHGFWPWNIATASEHWEAWLESMACRLQLKCGPHRDPHLELPRRALPSRSKPQQRWQMANNGLWSLMIVRVMMILFFQEGLYNHVRFDRGWLRTNHHQPWVTCPKWLGFNLMNLADGFCTSIDVLRCRWYTYIYIYI